MLRKQSNGVRSSWYRIHGCMSSSGKEEANDRPIYRDLCNERAEIRLCRILSGSGHSPVDIELSYVWGLDPPLHRVHINGQPKPIRENLFLALRRLRQRRRATVIWIDALCINQDNDFEKTWQVALMAQIFQKAREVVIWLGETEATPGPDVKGDTRAGASKNDSDSVVEAVTIVQMLAQGRHFHELPYFSHCRNPKCPAVGLVDSSGTWARGLRCLRDLLDVAWFNRTWIVQEVVHAASATVRRGPVELAWDTLTAACSSWLKHFDSCCHDCIFDGPLRDFEHLQRVMTNVTRLHHAQWDKNHDQSLYQVLIDFADKEATNPKDKIYGLLNLQSQNRMIKLEPDYSRSIHDVLVDTAMAIVQKEQWMLTLHCDLEQSVECFPSWVPDWTRTPIEPVAFWSARLQCAKTYNAALGLQGSFEFTLNDGLKVTAAKVDHVVEVSTAHRWTPHMVEQLEMTNQWFDFIDGHDSTKKEYVGGGTIDTAFNIALFAGRYEEGLEFRPATMQDVENLRKTWSRTRQRLRLEPDARSNDDPDLLAHTVAGLRRRMCVTAKGFVGLCPYSVEPGDEIFIILNAPAPIFLRPCEPIKGAHFVYRTALGHGYIHGLMEGEALQMNLDVVDLYIK